MEHVFVVYDAVRISDHTVSVLVNQWIINWK